MNKILSFYEILSEDQKGQWCDGLIMLTLSDSISFYNIYSNAGNTLHADNIPTIPLIDKVFVKVSEMDYQDAVRAFSNNGQSIISPKVKNRIVTFDGIREFEYGGNVFSHTQDNKIIVNDKYRYQNIDEIVDLGFISQDEIKGKWLVF